MTEKRGWRLKDDWHIVPLEEITGAWPDCHHCTWVAVGGGIVRLKYVNNYCPVHQNLERI